MPILACVLHGGLASPAWAQPANVEVLARVDVIGPVIGLDLPVHAFLQDALGQEYLIVAAWESHLADAG